MAACTTCGAPGIIGYGGVTGCKDHVAAVTEALNSEDSREVEKAGE